MLSENKCVPCEGGVPPLTDYADFLEELDNWQVVENKLEKSFEFSNFKEALSFVNKVGDIAESEGHHPDLFLHDYKLVKITLFTHAINGLSKNDFIVAAKIDNL